MDPAAKSPIRSVRQSEPVSGASNGGNVKQHQEDKTNKHGKRSITGSKDHRESDPPTVWLRGRAQYEESRRRSSDFTTEPADEVLGFWPCAASKRSICAGPCRSSGDCQRCGSDNHRCASRCRGDRILHHHQLNVAGRGTSRPRNLLQPRSPGEPEAAQNVIFNAPEGVFGNPNAATPCTSVDFATDQCPSNSQVGLITIRANYEGNTEYLLGTAPIYDLDPRTDDTALFAFIVPTLNIPISIPVAVRTESDYGLRFTVQDITQLIPLERADLTFWGFPADPGHAAERFPQGTLGNPAGCAGLLNTSCNLTPTRSSLPNNPLTDNPTTCTGERLKTTLNVQTYQDPEESTEAESSYPATTGCENEVFKPVLFASPTTEETDSASGLNVELNAPQFEGFAVSPSEIKSATVTLPPGFTINPDAADGQTMCTEAQANFNSEGPAECPDSSKIGTFSIGTPSLNGRLEGSVYIGEPKPGDQYRLFEIASGFGINAKLIGSVKPNPETGQLTAYFENLPQAPFEDFQLHLFSGERALMATPITCTIYTVNADFVPWDEALAPQEPTRSSASTPVPTAPNAPARSAPSTRALKREPPPRRQAPSPPSPCC